MNKNQIMTDWVVDDSYKVTIGRKEEIVESWEDYSESAVAPDGWNVDNKAPAQQVNDNWASHGTLSYTINADYLPGYGKGPFDIYKVFDLTGMSEIVFDWKMVAWEYLIVIGKIIVGGNELARLTLDNRGNFDRVSDTGSTTVDVSNLSGEKELRFTMKFDTSKPDYYGPTAAFRVDNIRIR